jgi:hypothetical protein
MLRYRNIMIPPESGDILFALSFMNCFISGIIISCEWADRHTMMDASLPERMQCPNCGSLVFLLRAGCAKITNGSNSGSRG